MIAIYLAKRALDTSSTDHLEDQLREISPLI